MGSNSHGIYELMLMYVGVGVQFITSERRSQ